MNYFKKIVTAFLLVIVFAVFIPSVSPMESSISNVEAAVKLNKKKLSLTVGKKAKLKIKGTKKKVKWSSNKKSVATVSKKGVVKAKKAGKATITARVGKKTYKCKVTVIIAKKNSVIEKKSVFSVDLSYLSVNVGSESFIRIKYNGSGSLTVAAGNDNLVTCEFGKWENDTIPLYVKGLMEGSTTITISNTENNEKKIVNVTVNDFYLDNLIANVLQNGGISEEGTEFYIFSKNDNDITQLIYDDKNNYLIFSDYVCDGNTSYHTMTVCRSSNSDELVCVIVVCQDINTGAVKYEAATPFISKKTLIPGKCSYNFSKIDQSYLDSGDWEFTRPIIEATCKKLESTAFIYWEKGLSNLGLSMKDLGYLSIKN